MMKKEYITPEMLIRRVILESMIAVSDTAPIGGGGGEWEGATARDNSNWDDEDESDNIWED